ncbi:MAG: response regulator [Acidobacteriota bacterium]
MARILVVDDEDSMRFLISVSLGNDYTVLEARNGQEGLRMVADHRPDLIITDLRMPTVAGSDFIRALRASSNKVKIIAYSASFNTPYDLEVMLEAGADLCLTKPLSLIMLKQTIAELLKQR